MSKKIFVILAIVVLATLAEIACSKSPATAGSAEIYAPRTSKPRKRSQDQPPDPDDPLNAIG